MKICPKCKIYKKNFEFTKRKNGKLYSWCRECIRKKSKVYYYKKKKENSNHFKEKSNTYYRKNPEIVKRINKKYNNKIKIEVLKYYSSGNIKCACCGETEIKFLAIDHINNNGKKDRIKNGWGNTFYRYLRKNNYPKGFQVLCHNCNIAKYMYGCCPHKNKK